MKHDAYNIPDRLLNRPRLSARGFTLRGFTLIEAVVSVLILAILLTGVLIAHQRSCDAVILQHLRTRAAAVAERRIELLLATREEPNSAQLHGRDELEPLFTWKMNLKREAIAPDKSPRNPRHSVVKATVTVEADLARDREKPLVEMVRFFGTNELKPLPGQLIAAPYVSEEEITYQELKRTLGREPTLSELLKEMIKTGQIPADEAQEIQDILDPNQM